MIKAALFDLDGTIGDTMPLCIESFRYAARAVSGKDIPDQEILARFGPNEEGMLKSLVPDRSEEALFAYNKYYEDMHHKWPQAFDGIVEILDFLRKHGVALGVVTGKARKSALVTMRQFGISNYFSSVETGSPYSSMKDIGIEKFVRNNRLSRDEVFYIGDSVADVNEARKARVQVFSAAWAAGSNREALEKANPDRIFDSVEEFAAFLREILPE